MTARCPTHGIPDCGPLLNGCSWRPPAAASPDLLALCGSCDAGLSQGCTCPDVRDVQRALLDATNEIERLCADSLPADVLRDGAK